MKSFILEPRFLPFSWLISEGVFSDSLGEVEERAKDYRPTVEKCPLLWLLSEESIVGFHEKTMK